MTERRTRRLTADNATNSDGEPLYIEIIDDLTWGELKRIQAIEKATLDQAAEAVAKYVTAWNVEGRNAETDELEVPPAPAEAGAVAFDAVQPWVISWAFFSLRGLLLLDRESLGKPPTPASDTPDGPSEQPAA
jgi:hypothetical protein